LQYFDNSTIFELNISMDVEMKTEHVVAALAALAQDSRLAIFRLLVQAGPQGLPATRIAEALGIAPSSLSFHLKELLHAEMVTQTREGRSLIYAANFQTMNGLIGFLTENCCGGNVCSPVRFSNCSEEGACS
jgi:DNA-binding transcriptional ArsR family regulator